MHSIFLGWHSPTVTCILALQPEKMSRIFLDSQKWHDSLNRKGIGPGMWAQQEQRSPARIVSEAISLKSLGNQGRVKGFAKSLQRTRVEML